MNEQSKYDLRTSRYTEVDMLIAASPDLANSTALTGWSHCIAEWLGTSVSCCLDTGRVETESMIRVLEAHGSTRERAENVLHDFLQASLPMSWLILASDHKELIARVTKQRILQKSVSRTQ